MPATIAILDGKLNAGLTDDQIMLLALEDNIRKISTRDIPLAVAAGWNGATTVASTIWIAHRAGIKVFATGGIGGVHRGELPDISADLPELARTPIIVVCSGAKIVLDLPATREWLETHAVTVVGYQCDDMPAFIRVAAVYQSTRAWIQRRKSQTSFERKESLELTQRYWLRFLYPRSLKFRPRIFTRF